MAHLVNPKDHDLPGEFLEYQLCTDMYHCPPSVLDEQDWKRVADHLLCRSAENKIRKARMK